MTFTYRNPRTADTYSSDTARPDLVANGWALIADNADAAAVAAVADLNSRRAGEAQLAALIAAAAANRATDSAAEIGKDAAGGVAGLDSGGHLPAAELDLSMLDSRYLAGTVSGITRDSSGRITAFVEGGVAWTVTYDASGRVAGYTAGTVTRTVSYDSAGRITGVN